MTNPGNPIKDELIPAIKYIVLVALLLWLPLCLWVLGDESPLVLFDSIKSLILACMFVSGAVIANATAVGGGMIFNPTLQLAFGVGGFAALTLSVLVQCAGMTSGSYGWYKKGEFANIDKTDFWRMIGVCIVSVAIFSLVFLWAIRIWPETMLPIMKAASAIISFYVFWIVWANIREKKAHQKALAQKQAAHDDQGVKEEQHALQEIDEHLHLKEHLPVRIDRRMYPWIVLGAVMNVSTSIGMGELVFSHLMKYYKAPPKTAIAFGTLTQCLAVIIQAIFILALWPDHIIPKKVLLGVLFCMAGGRLAPFILTRPYIEPHVKHILAFTALAMSITSGVLLFI